MIWYNIYEVMKMRPRKYHVELNEEEQKILEEIINKGKKSASKIKHAQILLKLD